MREQCIPSLVESWFQILQRYQQSHPELTCQCLEVVGAFVSWIDLNLIANDRSESKELLFIRHEFIVVTAAQEARFDLLMVKIQGK